MRSVARRCGGPAASMVAALALSGCAGPGLPDDDGVDTDSVDTEVVDTVDTEVVDTVETEVADTVESDPADTDPAPPSTDDPVAALAPDLWLRADDVVGVADRETFTTWPAHRGFGDDAVAPQPSMAPQLRTRRVHGEPMVRFDGVDDRLDLVSDPFASSQGEAFTVFAVVSTADTDGLIVGRHANTGGSQDRALVMRSGRPDLRSLADGVGVSFPDAPRVDDLQWRLVSGVVDQRTSALFVDGALVSASRLAPPARPAATASVGGGWAPPVPETSTALDLDLAEVLVWGRALSTCERWAVESYLARRYDLPLTQDVRPPVSRYVAGDLASRASGDPIGLWQEHPGPLPAAGALAMGVAERQPVWSSEALGGRGAVRFDGVDDRLDHAYNAFGPDQAGGLSVVTAFATTAPLGMLVGTAVAPPDVVGDYGGGLAVRDHLLVAKAANGPLGLRVAHPVPVDDGAVHLGVATWGDERLEVRVDGVGATTRGRIAIATTSNSAVGGVVDAGTGGTAVPLAADVGEVRLFRYALDACAVHHVEAELAATWGVTLP
ncbi:MAG: hypothetical protein H6733_00750 [Alphaproteobacteria bacterium]|nr:hypothetical protein [Alphaproteobacteria bacterium]